MDGYSYLFAEKKKIPAEYPQQRPILDLFSLGNKVAVITGGSRGIGYAIADCYSQAGADVAIVDYVESKSALESLQSQYKNRVRSYVCDVSDWKQVSETVGQIALEFGTIDIFVANAGITWPAGAILDVEDPNCDKYHRIINVDLNGVYYCAKAVGEVFRRKGKGSMIITASMSGRICNVPCLLAPYNAAKAGVAHLAKSLAVEWSSFARVNSVSPGYVDSGINDHLPREYREKMWSLVPMGREGLPFELTGAYLYLASDAASYTTGCDLVCDGGYTCV